MPVKKIECYNCGLDLGEIRDATLRKNIIHYCDICHNQMQHAANQIVDTMKAGKYKNPYLDTLNNLYRK